MVELKYNGDTLNELFEIGNDRGAFLGKEVRKIIEEFIDSDDEDLNTWDLIKRFNDLAKTENEQLALMYAAGECAYRLFER